MIWPPYLSTYAANTLAHHKLIINGLVVRLWWVRCYATRCIVVELESKLNCQPVPACARYHTLSECVDGVAGRQVGAGDKVFTVGRLDLHPRPALQVAMETIHLTSGEGDVGNAALAAVPWRATTKAVMYKHVHIKFSHHNHDRQMHFRSVFFSLANVGAQIVKIWFICVLSSCGIGDTDSVNSGD